MEKKTKMLLLVVLGIATLGIGAGTALYFYRRKHPKEAEAVEVEKDSSGEPSLDSTDVKTVEFSTDIPQGSDEIKSFQTWVNTVHKPTPLLKVDGIWGSKSQAKWDEFGKAYGRRNRTIGGAGSGFTYNAPLYAKENLVNVYSYPSTEAKYLLGYAKKSAKFFARFYADANTVGWIKAKVMYNELSGGKLVAKIAYVQLKDVTTVAP
jgi:hypothetical protein